MASLSEVRTCLIVAVLWRCLTNFGLERVIIYFKFILLFRQIIYIFIGLQTSLCVNIDVRTPGPIVADMSTDISHDLQDVKEGSTTEENVRKIIFYIRNKKNILIYYLRKLQQLRY